MTYIWVLIAETPIGLEPKMVYSAFIEGDF